MGIYYGLYSSDEFTLKEYLRKSRETDSKRKMTPEEFNIYRELREVKKAMNHCMTELMFTKNVIKKLQIMEAYWVVNNFERIIKSLFKQRQFIMSVSAAFSHRKPEPNEMKAIKGTIKKIKDRIEYLNKVPITENIKLTPIWDYLTLMGEISFADEIRNEFDTAKDVFESYENGRMDEYIMKMMDALRKSGKEDVYRARLTKYCEREKEMKEKVQAEKKAEKMANALNESLNGMGLFRELFFKGIRTLDGNPKINLAGGAVRSQLKRGNRGKFCILCCRFSQGKLLFRYMLANGKESTSFQNAGLYPNLPEAGKALREFQQMYPKDRVFEAVCI